MRAHGLAVDCVGLDGVDTHAHPDERVVHAQCLRLYNNAGFAVASVRLVFKSPSGRGTSCSGTWRPLLISRRGLRNYTQSAIPPA